MNHFCKDCRVPLPGSEIYCVECLEGRRKITQLIIQDPAAKAVRAAQDAINQSHAMLGGMRCHKCERTCDPYSVEAECWMSRETCPTCMEKLLVKSREDQIVRNAQARLRTDDEE